MSDYFGNRKEIHMRSLNLKSVFLGICLTLILVLLLGAYSSQSQAAKYQLCMSTGSRGNLYFARMDVSTGEIEQWKVKANNFKEKR